ncbi:HTH-type transcriptional repressor RspR [Clostridiales bacterium]|nr:HTH-type transcriptional repressor RspR [Clostridiales bacterium]
MADYKVKITENEYLPLRDVVFNIIKDGILTGRLRPGERLLENQLAEELGVSRTPIREALRMLEIENLVDLIPRRGAQVKEMSEKDIMDVLEIRKVLEELASGLAAKNITKQQIEELKKTHCDFVDAFDRGDSDGVLEADTRFHDIIFNSTKNDKLVQIISNISIQIYRYRITYLKLLNNISVPNQQHLDIISALEKRDAVKARIVSREHIEDQTMEILRSLRGL